MIFRRNGCLNFFTFPVRNSYCLAKFTYTYPQLSVFCEIVFIIDVFFSCITTYINDDGVVISDLGHIFSHYVKSWFFVDFLAAIPWEFLIIASNSQDVS